ncbi:unnamed protein product [Protopolystoma xenopodis]|uniref:Receptor L-domain domain-containing protein n=1 Tax=Protopolystoma xenopodis TaxID=117903 RepID=A0A3S5BEN2_9PLAT|nr:unnamed protein product [Protopolystoma xenopodis]
MLCPELETVYHSDCFYSISYPRFPVSHRNTSAPVPEQTSGAGIIIMNSSDLTFLGLRKLKLINGDVALRAVPNLCYLSSLRAATVVRGISRKEEDCGE